MGCKGVLSTRTCFPDEESYWVGTYVCKRASDIYMFELKICMAKATAFAGIIFWGDFGRFAHFFAKNLNGIFLIGEKKTLSISRNILLNFLIEGS